MEEKETITPPETPAETIPKTPEPQSSKLINNATQAAERLEVANKKQEELLNRQEELMARQALGGQTIAGQKPKEKTADEKWEENAKTRYEGTGLDPTPDNTKTSFG